MSKGNKFAFLSDRTVSSPLIEEEKVEPAASPPSEPPATQPRERVRSVPNEVSRSEAEPESLPALPARKMGRPPGKRSNPNYEQITAYIRKETHLEVKASLLRDSEGRDFSELLQELLDEYLRTRKSENSKI